MKSRLTLEIASLAAVCLLFSFVGSTVPYVNAKANSYHDPIVIDGDANFTFANGVARGVGTLGDPYVIEGWDISGVGSSGAAVLVNNTTASFVVRDVSVILSGSGTGVLLQDVVNGTVENVTVSYCDSGISLVDSSNSTIVGSRVSNCVVEGVRLDNNINATVRDCVISSNDVGIFDFIGVGPPWGSYPRIVDGNSLTGNRIGLDLGTPYAIVGNNSFSANDVGLISYVGWVTMTCNYFSDSVSFAIKVVAGAPSNVIWNNTFYDNNGAGVTYSSSHIQAYDDGTNTQWNIVGYGNYWSDWQSPDADHDGIVDVAYDLADNPVHMVAGSDLYPLTTPTVIPEFAIMPLVSITLLAVVIMAASIRRREY